MNNRERNDSGRYVETVTPDAVLNVFNQVHGPVVTSRDVADTLGCTTEAARQKLKNLHEQGKVEKRKTGRTVVWWLTESSEEKEHE